MDKLRGRKNVASSINGSNEHEMLWELRELQMDTINRFHFINENINFPALKVVLLEGLSQSKAFWEEINQLLLVHLGERNALNVIKNSLNPHEQFFSDYDKDDLGSLIKNIKLFEENTMSFYRQVLDNPISEGPKNLLLAQLELLKRRYHRLQVLERKLAMK
jgi:hypothetical protein